MDTAPQADQEPETTEATDFETPDLGLAVFLVAKGYPLIDIGGVHADAVSSVSQAMRGTRCGSFHTGTAVAARASATPSTISRP